MRSSTRFFGLAGAALLLVLSVLLLAPRAPRLLAQDEKPPQPESSPRFVAVNVFVDTRDRPLAAYQIDLGDEAAGLQIVGVEGGEHAAFSAPPYYDPKALADNRIVIAAMNTGTDLPVGKTRVARIHLRIEGGREAGLTVRESLAASPDGGAIPSSVSVEEERRK